MDTQIYHKNKTFKITKALFIFLLPLVFIAFLLISASNLLVFAKQEKINDDTAIKGAFFTPDSKKELISYGPKLVIIKRGKNVFKVLTKLTTVEDILRENSITLERNEILYLNTEYILDGSIIRIVTSETITIESYFDIPFEEEIVKSNMYLKGEEHISQVGINGIGKRVALNTYEDGLLVNSVLISEEVQQEPVKQIVEVGTSQYLLKDIELRGYNCPFWYSVVDEGNYSAEEKRWLKFVMHCESGCNAESDKGNYKGLFQWSPYWWSKQFSENIFDGFAQIKHTLEKYRAGESTRASQWPACNAKYLRTYGSN